MTQDKKRQLAIDFLRMYGGFDSSIADSQIIMTYREDEFKILQESIADKNYSLAIILMKKYAPYQIFTHEDACLVHRIIDALNPTKRVLA